MNRVRAMLPLAHIWPVRCARCGHKGEVNAALSELSAKVLHAACLRANLIFE
jgi:hypothetical protein